MHTSSGCARSRFGRAGGAFVLMLVGTATAQATDFCNLQFPSSFTAASGATSPLVYGRIFEDDGGVLTASPGAHPAIVGQLGLGPLGSDPRGGNPAWQWFAGSYNVQVGNDDEYQGTFTVPFAPSGTQLSYTYRFSIDSGASFTYCDTDGNGTNGGLSFSTSSLGTVTISPGGLAGISVGDVALAEGNGGTTAFVFPVSLTGPSTAAVTFDIATADNTATTADGDYLANSAAGVVIPAGQTSTTFTVQVNGDATVEPNQVFFVNLTNVTGAVVVDGQGAGTMLDDDVCAGYVFPYTLGGSTPAELIGAINCANANGAGSDTIDLGGQTVTLTANHVTIVGSNNGLPEITSAIVIRNGTIMRSSADLFRFFTNSGNLTLSDLTLANGDSQADGGAIYASSGATLTINRGRLIGNYGNFGGAIFNSSGATTTLDNTLVSGNRSNSQGGGIRNRGTLVLRNSTVAANFTTSGAEGGGGIANAGTFSLTLNNSIVFGNEASSFPATNEIVGAFTSNNSLVGVNPAFVLRLDASDTAPTTGGDYRLGSFSAAIDAGDNGLVPGGVTTDLDGNARFFDDVDVADSGVGAAPVVDLGAYERQSESLPPQADLGVTKTDGQLSTVAGNGIVYTLVASNAGPDAAPGATVQDTFPAALSGITWTCVGSGGGTCTAAGAGDINETVNLPAGGSVTYTATATIVPTASGVLSNTATASVGGLVQDPVGGNDSATDTTTVVALPLLSVEDFSAAEGDSGSSVFGITVSLSTPAPTGGVSFDIGTSDAGASAGSDYVARALTAQTIPAGSSSYIFDVTVNGDAQVEANESLLIDVANVGGALVADAQGVATLVNDDVAGVTIAPTTVDVAEGGATDTYSVVLTSEPTGTVTVSASGDAQASVSPTSLSFSAADWDLPQSVTVTAIDDAIVEGAHVAAISHVATGGGYDAVAIAGVTANVGDNDTAGVMVAASAGSTAVTEGGADDTFSVVLTSQPSSDVTIALTADAQVSANPSTLVFTTANWNVAQTVTVAAIDDDVAEGNHAGSIVFAVTSADAGFDGLAVAALDAAVSDNDTAAVIITPSAGSTAASEAGATDSYAVVLGSEPVGNVSISAGGDAQVLAAPAALTFTPADWNVPQTVTVSAIDDAVAEGAHTGSISHAAMGGGYDAVVVAGVTVDITDNDFTIGGNVAGLAGAGLVLQNNGGDDLAIAANGSFTFGTALADGSSYGVTVLSQPTAQTCVVGNGSGTLSGANVAGISINCSNDAFALALSTTRLDLGNPAAGGSSAQFTITNVGNGDLVLSAISAPAAPFSLSGGTCLALPLTLAPGAECTVDVGFAPTAAGLYSASVLISSNADGSPHEVTLQGSLTPRAVPIPGTGPFALLLLLALVGGGAWRTRGGLRRG